MSYGRKVYLFDHKCYRRPIEDPSIKGGRRNILVVFWPVNAFFVVSWIGKYQRICGLL